VRIAIVGDLELVNANYRAYQPMRELLLKGHDVSCQRDGEPRVRLERALSSDVLYIHRYVDEELVAVVRRCRDEGVAVVWDNDDDLTAVPKGHPRYRHFAGPRRQQLQLATRRMVAMADIVTTPSEHLAAKFMALGASDVRVVENFLPREFIGTRTRSHVGVVIGWIAGLEHQADYQALRLRETLTRLLQAHEDVRVHSVGLALGLAGARYEHVRGAEFLELAQIAAGYDVGIAPLADIPFNRSRSNVKLKEYASAGVPWLASPVGAYASMGAEQGGRLVSDDRWYEELDRLIVSARERRKLARRAAKWGRRQGIAQNIGVWEAIFDDAARNRRVRQARPA
jgi:Glycosyl transferases group 1